MDGNFGGGSGGGGGGIPVLEPGHAPPFVPPGFVPSDGPVAGLPQVCVILCVMMEVNSWCLISNSNI